MGGRNGTPRQPPAVESPRHRVVWGPRGPRQNHLVPHIVLGKRYNQSSIFLDSLSILTLPVLQVMVEVSGIFRMGIVKYVGETEFAGGEWVGVALDRPCGQYSTSNS